MANLEPLNIKITGNAAGLSSAIGSAQGQISSFASSITSKLSAALAFAAPAAGGGALGFATKLAADAQDAELTFKALTGSAAEAKRVLADLQAFSASTPFEFTNDVKPAAQQLLTYGFSVEELQDQLRVLGNVAAVSGADFTELAKLVGRARSTNLIMTEDLNQFSDRAIPVLDLLAERFGVTAAEVRKLASEGKINFGDLQAVLQTLGGEGGKFGTAMEERSRTLNGQISTLKDNIGLLAQQIGESLLPAANSIVGSLAGMVEWLKGMDVSSVEATAKLAALSAGFAVGIAIIPKLITAARALVVSIRAIGTASAIAQAFSGPAGWASLAAGIAVAAGAVYGVDQFFEGLGATQTTVAASGEAVAKSFTEIEKRAIESGNAVEKLKKGQENWEKQAASNRDSLLTPLEAYEKRVEDLSLAVTEGGLDFEFFARGVRKAYEELQRANGLSDKFQAPKAILAGSYADQKLANNGATDRLTDDQGKQKAVADSLKSLSERIAEESKANAETMADAAIDAANLSVEKLTSALADAQKRLEGARESFRNALAAEQDRVNGKSGFFASQISGLKELGGINSETPTDLTPQREALGNAISQVESLQKQLATAQQQLADSTAGRSDQLAAKVDETNRLLEKLNSLIAKNDRDLPPVNY